MCRFLCLRHSIMPLNQLSLHRINLHLCLLNIH
nr:MAG TPA: hypothetical protein [Caudoviricetes sp.]